MARGNRSARAHLLLYSLVHDDVGVGRHRQREHQAGDARQRERDRDQLDQREQQHRVDQQRGRGHQAEHAVEDEQEQDRERQAHARREQALVERLLAERRRHLGLRDQLEVDRQRADAQALGEVVGRLEVARRSRSGRRCARRCPRALDEVDRRQRDDLVVERDREALGSCPCRTPGCSADWLKPRSAIRFVTRAKASRPWSVNSIVTSGAFVFGSVLASGFLMSSPESSESSSSTVKRLIWGGWLGVALLLDDHDALGHLDHARARRRAAGAERLELGQALGVLGVLLAGPGLGVVVGQQLLAGARRLVVRRCAPASCRGRSARDRGRTGSSGRSPCRCAGRPPRACRPSPAPRPPARPCPPPSRPPRSPRRAPCRPRRSRGR